MACTHRDTSTHPHTGTDPNTDAETETDTDTVGQRRILPPKKENHADQSPSRFACASTAHLGLNRKQRPGKGGVDTILAGGASNVDEVLLEIGAVGERNPLQEQTTPLLFAVAAAERHNSASRLRCLLIERAFRRGGLTEKWHVMEKQVGEMRGRGEESTWARHPMRKDMPSEV
eukprot:134442-Rhodomonas_salina.1